jgi:large subunit ribosomal protein L17
MAMLRNQVKDLLNYERIRTTEAKAKEVRPLAEQMITLGKNGGLHARRQALAFLNDKGTVSRIFTDLAPRFATRPGGYTRIVKLGPRPGDGARMAQLELVDAQ